MAKLTLSDLSSLSNANTAIVTINANSALIEGALENTLSRDGTSPNQMTANLDMNSHRILNLPSPVSSLEPLRLTDLDSFVNGSITFNNLPTGGVAGSILAKNSTSNYDASFLTQVNIPNTGPTWASFSTIYTGISSNVNSFPITSRAAANTLGSAEALVGLIEVPASVVNANAVHSSGVSGYARSANPTQGAVALFGIGMVAADSCQAWGCNVGVTNNPAPGNASGSNLTNTGYHNANLYGIEIDVLVSKRSTGASPGGNLRGLYIIGSSRSLTTGVNYAIDIDSPGVFESPKLKWDSAFHTNAGATDTGIDLAQTGTGDGVPSQRIFLRCKDVVSAEHSCIFQTDTDGNLVITPRFNESVGVVTVPGGIVSSSSTSGVGYNTGAGGAVTQATNKSTGVTLNKVCGAITMNNATLNAGVEVAFTLTNSTIAATDVVVVSIKSGGTSASYATSVTATAAGSCEITLSNLSGSNLGEALVLNFVVIKGVVS